MHPANDTEDGMISDRMAIDVALLLPEEIRARAEALHSTLREQRPDGFRFDETHHPHISLAQQFVRQARLPALIERVDSVLRGLSPLSLRVLGVRPYASVTHFLLERAPELVKLHETLMQAVEPFEEPTGAAEAFYSQDDEPARPEDVDWVRQYRSHASYANFVPHVTLGIGIVPESRETFAFTAHHVGLFHLGRFCTCRVLLRKWILEVEP